MSVKYFIGATEITYDLESAIDTPISASIGAGSTTFEAQSTKPLTKLYFDLTAAHDGTLAVQYWNGSSFVAVTGLEDRTDNLVKRGWIKWTKGSDAKDGSYYKYRFVLSGVTTPVSGSLRFIGVIFAEDKDCKTDVPDIADYIPSGDTSLLRFHVSGKDDLVNFFRAKGKNVFDTDYRKLTEYDFHDPEELKQAGKYMALAKVFFWRSDSVDDKWYSKAKDFEAKGYSAANVYFLSLDTDGDGVEDDNEKQAIQELRIVRV